ncbi:MAG: TraU family protein [Betaproteobacteria bacterium]|nr:TraU family protein [Betaproteobacteria bacterium]
MSTPRSRRRSTLGAWVIGALLALAIAMPAPAATCTGRFADPLTDICWSCVFPLSIGAATVASLGQEDIANPASPVCACPGVPPRVGLSLGFWEPARQIDVTRQPFCLVGLGGIDLNPGIAAPQAAQTARLFGHASSSFYQAHFYLNPVLYWLEVLLDFPCLEKGAFDIAYLTEVDPLWNDDELTLILNPEAVLFANPLAQAACAADCVAATLGFGLPQLFWCAGCQGSVYPLNGHVAVHLGGVQASMLIAQRLTAKMHRQLIAWGYHGSAALCSPYLLPVLDKTAYKTQMTYPIPDTAKLDGRCCQPLGRSTTLWGAGKEYPVQGEDFSYLLFRKRNCCAGAF